MSDPVEPTLTCTAPFRYGRRIGDTWQCPDCGREWFVDSNLYDSLLPFGDYTWWTEVETPGSWGRLFGPSRRRAVTFQVELPDAERAVIGKVQHALDTLGLSHTLALAPYDLNPSANLPYHGAAHMLSTALRAWRFANEEDLAFDAARPLLVAALLHDADYLPGAGGGCEHPRAAAFTRRHAPASVRDAAEELVRATAFPHDKPKNAAAGIIKDADLLQTVGLDAGAWLAALEAEAGTPADPDFPKMEWLHTTAGRDYRARRGS